MGEGYCTQPYPCICKEAVSGFEPMTNKSPRHNFTAAPGLALLTHKTQQIHKRSPKVPSRSRVSTRIKQTKNEEQGSVVVLNPCKSRSKQTPSRDIKKPSNELIPEGAEPRMCQNEASQNERL
ncbi:hypothetical protein HKD37_11G031667 [Glycine soja]